MNEAVGVRIQVVLAGLPRIVTNRLGMNIERRFVFQLADPNEYADRRRPASRSACSSALPRRAVDVPAKRIVQFAQLAAPGRPRVRSSSSSPSACRRRRRGRRDRSPTCRGRSRGSRRRSTACRRRAHLVSPLPVGHRHADRRVGVDRRRRRRSGVRRRRAAEERAQHGDGDDGPAGVAARLVGAQRRGCRAAHRWRRGTTRRSAGRSLRRTSPRRWRRATATCSSCSTTSSG